MKKDKFVFVCYYCNETFEEERLAESTAKKYNMTDSEEMELCAELQSTGLKKGSSYICPICGDTLQYYGEEHESAEHNEIARIPTWVLRNVM